MASALAEAYVTVSMDGGKVPSQLSNLKSMVAGAVGDMASTFAMTGFVFHKLVDTAKEFAMAISEDEEEVIRFNNAVEASGRGQAFVQMTQQIGRASAATTAFSEDAVRAAATAIAPFKTLSNEMAGRVLVVAQDLAAQFGGTLTDKARVLAIALERPEVGLRRLRAANVFLTSAQTEQIQTMLKLGQVAEAQEMILTISAEKGHGAAVKMAGTLKGIWTRIKTELGELSEAMGGKMMDSLKAFGETAIAVLKGFRDLLEGDTLVGKIAQMAAGFLAFAIAGSAFERVFSTVKGLLWGTLGPLGWVIAGVSAIAFQFVSLSDILAWFRSAWAETVAVVVTSGLWDRLVVSVQMLGEAFLNLFATISGRRINWYMLFDGLGDQIAWAIKKLTEFSIAVIDAVTSVVQNSKTYWSKIELVSQKTWETILDYMESIFLPKVTGVFAAFVAIVKRAMEDAKQWFLYGLNQLLRDNDVAMFLTGAAFLQGGPMGAAAAAGAIAGTRAAPAFPRPETSDYGAIAEKTMREQRIREDKNISDQHMTRMRNIGKLEGLERGIDKTLAADAEAREIEKDNRVAAAKDRAETDRWMKYLDDLEASEDDQFEADKGGKKLKEEKEKSMATGFVGVAEFAKQFQASILKSEADKYAKTTADNTGQIKIGIDKLNDKEEPSIFGEED